jgi:3-hydroxyisobutyrate dehydrogenase-like beta-hydroxyacid dehydrogenase
MTRIAFLGLGRMGTAMARNLAAAGYTVTVWNRTPKPPTEVPGARIAATIADAARDAEVAVTMLSDDRAVESVVFREGGLLASLPRGALHLGCSTISVALAERLVAAHEGAGQRFVAAPVFGRPDAAAKRQLWIVPGGSEADIAACADLFSALGRGTFPMPTAPQAALAKILGNFMIAATVESLAETLTLAERAGLAPERLLAMLTGTLFGSPVVERYGGLIARTEFQPAGFAMPLGLKDVDLALAAAEPRRVPLPLASLLRDHFLEALAKGRDDWDWSGVASVVREAAGLPPVRPATPGGHTPGA